MPYKTTRSRAPIFMTHKGVKVYHVFRHDDADSGVLRTYAYTLDPLDGSDDDPHGRVTFDVRSLSTTNHRALTHEVDEAEEKAIKAAIRAALDKGEIGMA